MSGLSSQELQRIIMDENATMILVKHAEDLGRSLKANLTTSQIRAIFGEVRQIEAKWSMGGDNRTKALNRLILLKPKMAYRSHKERGKAAEGVQELVSVLDPAVDIVVNAKPEGVQDACFARFVNFFEAILAYHKAAGGK